MDTLTLARNIVGSALLLGLGCGPQILAVPDGGGLLASHAPPQCDLGAQVTYAGGPVLSAVEVTTIYWDGAEAQLQPQLDAFFAAVTQSPFLSWLDEYAVAGAYPTIGAGSFRSSIQLPSAPGPTGGVISDQAIQQQLSTLDGQGQLSTNLQAVFFVFMPAGAVIVDPQGHASSGSFDGYHNSFNDTVTHRELFYAVIPDPSLGATQHGLSSLDFVTLVCSHELAEAITDPSSLSPAWYDPSLGEIGDICAWKYPPAHVSAGGQIYAVQREWSEKQLACVYQPSPLGLSACGASCVDLSSDSNNCGGCGIACPSNQACVASSCQ